MTGPSEPPEPSEPLGSLAQEAVRLLAAAQEWARRAGERCELAAETRPCTICPICQLIAVLRGDRPDLSARIGEIVMSVLAAFQESVSGHAAHGSGSATAGGAPGAPAGRRLQPIDLNGAG